MYWGPPWIWQFEAVPALSRAFSADRSFIFFLGLRKASALGYLKSQLRR